MKNDKTMTTVGAASAAAGAPQPRRHLVLAIVSIALLMASVDQTIVATALPSIQHDLNAPITISTWTITVYALGQIVAMPLAGRLSDLYGRKRLFLCAVALFTVASTLCALATNIYVLVALRALQALGGGAFLPSATGIVSDQYGRDRDRAIGLFTSVFPIGGLIGPVLGGLFVTIWSWRGIFVINIPLGLVLLALGAWLLPATSGGRARTRIDFLGIALMVAGLIGVLYAISTLGSQGVTVAGFAVPLSVGAALLVVFVRHCAVTEAPFMPVTLIRRREFAVMNLINVLSGAASIGFGALIPLYAVHRYGMSELTAGTLLTARAVGTIAVAGVAAFAIRRTGYRWPMRIGFLITGGGLIAIASAPVAGVSPQLWLTVSGAITGIGMGISIPSNNNAGLDLAPDDAAAISGLRAMSRQIGGIIGVSVIAAASAGQPNSAHAQAWAYLVLGVIMLLLVPLVSVVPEKRGRW